MKGLPVLKGADGVEELEGMLREIFEPYEPEKVKLVAGKGIAFVKVCMCMCNCILILGVVIAYFKCN